MLPRNPLADSVLEVVLPDASAYVHADDAGQSKEGPSAGVTFAAALVFALAGQPVRDDVAMTGELTLAGTVEPASIRERVLAACRAGMAAVILPVANNGRR